MSVAQKNRQALFDKLPLKSISILPGGVKKYRSRDSEYLFRQDSDFYYLTEIIDPDALAVFIKEDQNNNKYIIFYKEQDRIDQIWNGSRSTSNDLILKHGVDSCYSIRELDHVLPELLLNKEILYYPLFSDLQFVQNVSNWQRIALQKAKKSYFSFPLTIKDLSVILHELRSIKSEKEVTKIRYVTDVSARAHNYIMEYVASGKNLTEKHVQAAFYSFCLQNGCEDLAYNPIVAAGNNACVLHYTKNSSLLKNNELLLVDAGAEYQYYAADITRVFPVSGKFSSPQRELYDLVLLAQKKAIEQIAPGTSWSKIQKTIVEILVLGLLDLKILVGDVEQIINEKKYQEFYMHGSGHFLGIDVHDVGVYSIDNLSRPLLPGMVLTVEPGLYIPNNANIDSKWQGIGIRIEDDILVTEQGFEILTSAAVKEINDIEHIMSI